MAVQNLTHGLRRGQPEKGGEACLALATEWRLSPGLWSFQRDLRRRYPPNCDVHSRDRRWQLYVETGRPLRALSGHLCAPGEPVRSRPLADLPEESNERRMRHLRALAFATGHSVRMLAVRARRRSRVLFPQHFGSLTPRQRG